VRVVVTGATGNVGLSVLRALQADPEVESICGLARRRPGLTLPRTTWTEVDVAHADLAPAFEGADAVVHLAWLIQPSRDESITRAVNVGGTQRVLDGVDAAGVPALVYASSVGAYAPGPKDRAVDESWPTTGIPTSYYSRHKAETERMLDRFEAERPGVRVVRMRPGLIFQREAASEIRRLFAGRLLPRVLLRPGLIPVIPTTERLRFQAVHSHDVGEAYHQAVRRDVRGAFNLAADPVLDAATLARALRARAVPVPRRWLRRGVELTWKAHLQPTSPDWLDMALEVPLMDSSRARSQLGWEPTHSATDTLLELLTGMREGAGAATAPLAPAGESVPQRLQDPVHG
jgi:nucleoside-diphosphate-sugar epimerase